LKAATLRVIKLLQPHWDSNKYLAGLLGKINIIHPEAAHDKLWLPAQLNEISRDFFLDRLFI